MATEYGLQTSAHRLDLGEFRHCRNQAPGFAFNPAAAMPATAVAAALSAGSPEILTAPSSSPAFPVAISARADLGSKGFEGGTCLEDGDRQRKVALGGEASVAARVF